MRFSHWHRSAWIRRSLLGILVLVPAGFASINMAGALPSPGNPWLNGATVLLFGVLTAWIAVGFWTALFGFMVLLRSDPRPNTTPPAGDRPPDPDARTALVFPVYRESPERIAATIQVMYRDLEEKGILGRFDFFILSDSNDPDLVVREQWAWAELCRSLEGFGRIYYRRRRSNIKRKSGNIADFLKRWGFRYRYMVVLDADSLMSAPCLGRLVELMEAHPEVGILQSVPGVVRQQTLFGRIQQFSNRVYSRMFASGLSFWQMGDSYYWGHNAIIRVVPFMAHCQLPRLKGRALLSGDILSHDFVEAALMRRAGWSVWLVPELTGSWEETPPTLLDELKRDRRWCFGNLQHLRLLFAKGLLAMNRLMFVNGAMSYVASALWFLYLLLGTAVIAWHAWVPPNYFPPGHGLFPVWPVWHANLAVFLLGASALILLLPRFLGLLLVFLKGRTAQFGGSLCFLVSGLLEIVYSTLLAPVRMLFHSWFVLSSLLGYQVNWGRQQRTAIVHEWLRASRAYIPGTLIAIGWAGLVYLLDPADLGWLLPIVAALVLAMPLAALAGSARVGAWARSVRLFMTPEEHHPPEELGRLEGALSERTEAMDRARSGFRAALADPQVNAVVAARLSDHPRRYNKEIELTRALYGVRLMARGPRALNTSEQLAVLNDRSLLLKLHEEVWTRPLNPMREWY